MKLPLLLCLALSGFAMGQGSLTPPGAPAPGMRTLEQLEPRIPLVSGSPGVTVSGNGSITISQPGSYVLTKKVTSTVAGIIINTDNVTVDLQGFTIVSGGAGVSVPGDTSNQRTGIVVRNGTIESSGSGVSMICAQQCSFEDLLITCSFSGIRFDAQSIACRGLTIRRCTIRGGSDSGIYVVASGGEVSDVAIEKCSITGFTGSSVSCGVTLGVGTINIRNSVIRDCVVSGCAGQGYSISCSQGVATNNLITGCQAWSCSGGGIALSCASGGTCRGNRLEKCTIDASGGAGNPGISLSIYGAGAGNVIADNIVTNVPGTGIFTMGTGNLTVRNTCTANTTNFNLSATNTNGPVVTTVGTLANTGADAHPQANFSR